VCLDAACQASNMDPRNVIACEKPGINDGEGVNVAFLDGHVQFMDMAEFEEALAATKQQPGVSGEHETAADEVNRP